MSVLRAVGALILGRAEFVAVIPLGIEHELGWGGWRLDGSCCVSIARTAPPSPPYRNQAGPGRLSLPSSSLFLSPTAKKKNKKGKTLTLTDFLAEDGGGGGGPTYIPKPVSWADETDDLEGDGTVLAQPADR